MNDSNNLEDERLDFMTTMEFATLVGCSMRTIERWRKEQRPLPHPYQFGRNVKYLRRDVLRWIAEQTNHP